MLVPAIRMWVFGQVWLLFDGLEGRYVSLRRGVAVFESVKKAQTKLLGCEIRKNGKVQKCAERFGGNRLTGS